MSHSNMSTARKLVRMLAALLIAAPEKFVMGQVDVAEQCLAQNGSPFTLMTDDISNDLEASEWHKIDRCYHSRVDDASFRLCGLGWDHDAVISPKPAAGHIWEPHITRFLARAMSNCPRKCVFLDVGANIGTHTIHLAARGHTVWAVEPVKMNAFAIAEGTRLSNITDNIVQVLDAVYNENEISVEMQYAPHFGVTAMVMGPGYMPSGTDCSENLPVSHPGVRTILLSDVIDGIVRANNGSPVSVVLKLDVEGVDCLAVRASKAAFTRPDVFIPYFVMEWELIGEDGTAMTKCSLEDVEDMVKFLASEAGYSPFHERRSDESGREWFPLSPGNFMKWGCTNVLWIHKDAKRDIIDPVEKYGVYKLAD